MQRGRGRKKTPIAPPSVRPSALSWRPLALVLVGALAYANSLAGPFIFDDNLAILQNAQIRQWWNLGAVLSPAREMPTAGRPLVNLSFAINYALGGLDVHGYHVFNLLCHLLCSLLLFGLVRRTLELPRLKDRFGSAAPNVAFGVALIWTIHPLNSEVVDYLTQRTESMMALFYVLTLYAAIRALDASARGWSAVAVLAAVAGMACKESMATVPLVVVMYDAIFVFGSWKRALRERAPLYALLAASWMVLAALLWSGPRANSAGFESGVSSWTYLLNQTVVITEYFWRALWPRALVINYGWPLDLTLVDVLPYAIFVTGLVALVAVALVRWPMVGFLGAWVFITLAPTSSIVPIATEVGAERRMYLPLMAIATLAVVAIARVLERWPLAKAREGALLVLAASALFVGTVLRNREYASELGLARTTVERRPTPVAHHALAVQLFLAGDREQGMLEVRKAIPGDPRAHHTLGGELLNDGRVDEAIVELQSFLRERPMLLEAVGARLLLGGALLKQARLTEAIAEGTRVLTMNPSEEQRLEAHSLLARSYFGAETFDQVVTHCQEYLRSRPDDEPLLTELAVALIATGRPTEALAAFRRAAAAAPTKAEARRNLANALYNERDFAGALAESQEAVRLRPTDADAHDLLGRSLAMMGRLDEARAQLERALQIDPAHADAKDHLQRLQTLIR